MIFFNPYHEENRSKILLIGPILISVDWAYTSAGETSRTGLGAIGPDDSGHHRKSGPLSHRLLFNRASAERAHATRCLLGSARIQRVFTARRSPVL